MENKKYSPAAMRSMLVTMSVILLVAVIAVVITTLSGSDRVSPAPSVTETDPQTEKEPGDIETEDVGGETESPVVKPPVDSDPELPTVTPIVWYMPVDGSYLSKGHDLTKQVYSQTMNDYRVHSGVDLQVSLGADVMAAADGVIETIYKDPFEGTCIRIAHKDGYVSVYKNLSPNLPEWLKEGDSVMGGQTIASVGESAIIEISDEAHLHYELYLNGKAIDPLSVLPYHPDDATFGE